MPVKLGRLTGRHVSATGAMSGTGLTMSVRVCHKEARVAALDMDLSTAPPDVSVLHFNLCDVRTGEIAVGAAAVIAPVAAADCRVGTGGKGQPDRAAANLSRGDSGDAAKRWPCHPELWVDLCHARIAKGRRIFATTSGPLSSPKTEARPSKISSTFGT